MDQLEQRNEEECIYRERTRDYEKKWQRIIGIGNIDADHCGTK